MEQKMTKATRTSKTIPVEHVRIASQRPFAEVRAALEISLSKLDVSIPAALRDGDQDRAERYEASGPKLSIFLERDHGSLLEIAGRPRNAIQYDIGNPLTASKMTRHAGDDAAEHGDLELVKIGFSRLIGDGDDHFARRLFVVPTRLDGGELGGLMVMMAGFPAAYFCIKAFSETDQTEDLKKFDVPTLIIQGDDDQIVPFADAGAWQAKLVRGAVLKVYKGAPHGLCTTHKDQVNEDLLAFFKAEAQRAA